MALRALALTVAIAIHGALAATPVTAEHAMVVSAQPLATKVGLDVLKAGGNAVDAAVAVGYALAVVLPAAGNLGGGGFMTLRLADGRTTFIDFREKAPLAATRDMYLDASGQVIAKASVIGHLAVAVPGTVSGLEYARAKYGTLARERLVAPAIAPSTSRVCTPGMSATATITWEPSPGWLRYVRCSAPAAGSGVTVGSTADGSRKLMPDLRSVTRCHRTTGACL